MCVSDVFNGKRFNQTNVNLNSILLTGIHEKNVYIKNKRLVYTSSR